MNTNYETPEYPYASYLCEDELELSEDVEFIDNLIDQGYSYEEASQAWFNRQEPEQEPAPQVETKVLDNSEELLVKLAVSRGYSQTEALQFLASFRKVAATDYAKAYRLFLARLES